MPGQLWQHADESVALQYCPHHQSKNIFFARKYSSLRGYSFSATNDLINNLKKDPLRKDLAVYKTAAIEIFAQEAAEFLNAGSNRTKRFLLTPMPPSKSEAHPGYDNRIERVALLVAQKCPHVTYMKLLRAKRDMQPAHHGGARDPDTLYDAMEWVPGVAPQAELGSFVVLDDVLTKGGHYEAARRHLVERYQNRAVSGMFWAKAE